jgi:hypothetical protein
MAGGDEVITDTNRLDELCEIAQAVIASSDDTGCTEDLTVVSKREIDRMTDFITNLCEADDADIPPEGEE